MSILQMIFKELCEDALDLQTHQFNLPDSFLHYFCENWRWPLEMEAPTASYSIVGKNKCTYMMCPYLPLCTLQFWSDNHHRPVCWLGAENAGTYRLGSDMLPAGALGI